MSCTLMSALSLESCLAPLTPAFALAFPFPLPLPLTGATGSGVTVPSALRTPQAGPVGAGRTGGRLHGVWRTRIRGAAVSLRRGVTRAPGGGRWHARLARRWPALRRRHRVLAGRRRLPGGRLPGHRGPVGLVRGCDRPLLAGR